jgi:hypothetical protein
LAKVLSQASSAAFATKGIHRPHDPRVRLRRSENETRLVPGILRPEDGGTEAACGEWAHGVSAVIHWLFESSGGLAVPTAFAAAFVAAIVWAAVWLGVVMAALALRFALPRLPWVRSRKAQSAIH